MIPLNEYPKEELEYLERTIMNSKMCMDSFDYEIANLWHNRIIEAISDQEFKEKELPFKTTEQK